MIVTGARQGGKTTLVQQVLGGRGTFQRLDDEATLQAAWADPAGFASYGELPRAFDEVQRAGDPLIRAVKAVVDTDASPGQFLLNGSADFLSVPALSESLAGRAALLELWPFSQGEIDGEPDGFLRSLIDDPSALESGPASRVGRRDYLDRLCTGGFPEPAFLPVGTRRTWFSSYVRTVIQRDVAELTGARKADQLPRLLRLLAARTAGELVVSDVHADLALGSRATTEDYISYLRMAYLVHQLPAWSPNLTNRAKRHPKVYMTDTALAAHLLGKQVRSLDRPEDPGRGPLIETFAVNELCKQLSWSAADASLHHFRDRAGAEIDVIVECPDGRVAGVEVKASGNVSVRDTRWLSWLRDRLGDQFVAGVVLYLGDRPLPFGDRVTAVPLSYLWLVG